MAKNKQSLRSSSLNELGTAGLKQSLRSSSLDELGTAGLKTVLITGATSGIGLELARIFAREGYSMVLVARNKSDLERVAHELNDFGELVKIISKDLSGQNAAEEIYKELIEDRIEIDVLVNNAGIGGYGEFVDGDVEVYQQMMNLNMVTLTKLTKLFLSTMVKKGQGKILNVASTAAYVPGPYMAVYYATKAYGLSFSLAIAEELKGTGVTVTALCPGPTATGFQNRAHAWHGLFFKRFFVMDAKQVALAGYNGLIEGKMVVVPGLRNKAMVLGAKIVPSTLSRKMLKLLQRRRKIKE